MGRFKILQKWLLLAVMVAPGLASAAPFGAREGVQEVVVGVRDLDASLTTLLPAMGYRLLWRGDADASLLALWQLPPDSRARQAVIAAPGTEIGTLRLVEFRAGPQVEIRSSARPFDTGGIFNINVFVRGIDDTFAGLQQRGFQGYADPSRYELFGRPYAGALVRGHDGLVLNLLERLDRGYDDVPTFTVMSHVLNSTLVVADFGAARRFFEDGLGWVKRWEASPKWQPDGRNNMGLPESLVMSGAVRERAASFAVSATADGGTIEILAFEGLRGHDYSDRTAPPNLGLLMYTIVVTDLDAWLAAARARGTVPLVAASTVDLAPYGSTRAAVVRAPGGAWLMFVQGGRR
jgi:hypothetical protein